MKDRYGHEFEELVKIQTAHLSVWECKLTKPVFAEVKEYCLAQNRSAETDQERHRVFRGNEIAIIIFEWPKSAPCLPKTKHEKLSAEDMI